MKPYKFIFTAFFMLACGVTTVPAPARVNMDIHTNTVQPTSAPTKSTGAVVCNSGGLNVRESAGTDAAVIVVLQDGESVVILADRAVITSDMAIWRRVNAGGVVGWVNNKYICEE